MADTAVDETFLNEPDGFTDPDCFTDPEPMPPVPSPPPPEWTVTTIREILAANFREYRARADFTQQDVAEGMVARGYTSWHFQTVGAVERGDRRLQAEEILGLADLFGTSISSLMRLKQRYERSPFPSGRPGWHEISRM